MTRTELLLARLSLKVGRCRLKPVRHRVDSARFQHLKRKRDALLSSLAFKVNLRRYSTPVLRDQRSAAAVGQVLPIKPVLKAPGTILLKLRCDGPLSNVGLKFNSRRHTTAAVGQLTGWQQAFGDGMVGRCRLTPAETRA